MMGSAMFTPIDPNVPLKDKPRKPRPLTGNSSFGELFFDREDYAGRTFRKCFWFLAVVTGLTLFALYIEASTEASEFGDTQAYTFFFSLSTLALTGGGGLIWFAKRACNVSAHMKEDQQRKEVNDRLVFNPVTFILLLICFPAWPFFLGVVILFVFFKACKHFIEGGRFMDQSVIVKNDKVCYRCNIAYSGDKCPKCGF